MNANAKSDMFYQGQTALMALGYFRALAKSDNVQASCEGNQGVVEILECLEDASLKAIADNDIDVVELSF